MAEEKIAEERLCLFTSVDYTISDTKDGVSFEGKIAPHKANIFTRQEAIERMAKAMRDTIIKTKAEGSCLDMAEAALNALLEE